MTDDAALRERCETLYRTLFQYRGHEADLDALAGFVKAEREALLPKYKALVAFYDKQVGTPCEEIRHRQQIEDVLTWLKGLVGGHNHDCAACAYRLRTATALIERLEGKPWATSGRK